MDSSELKYELERIWNRSGVENPFGRTRWKIEHGYPMPIPYRKWYGRSPRYHPSGVPEITHQRASLWLWEAF
jgi:hypothetical protein